MGGDELGTLSILEYTPSSRVSSKAGSSRHSMTTRSSSQKSVSESMDLHGSQMSSPVAHDLPVRTRAENNPSAVAFQFVNISEPTDIKNSDTRKLIRSSVAYDFRRKQHLRHSNIGKDGAHACLNASMAAFPVLNFCPVCGYPLAKRKKRTGAKDGDSSPALSTPTPTPEVKLLDASILGNAKADPFSSYPIPVQPYMHTLVDHYISSYCPTLQPFGKWDSATSPIITRLFKLAIQNPVYFHASLCISATHFMISSGQDTFSVAASRHRGEAVMLLNEMLQDQSEGITQLMIATVGSLANHDIMIGDSIGLENHRRGIVEMIKWRGGMQNPSLDCLLRYRALWIDLVSAEYNLTSPLFSLDELPPTPNLAKPLLPLNEGFKSLRKLSLLSTPMADVFVDLAATTSELEQLSNTTPSGEQILTFTARRARIEWYLHTSLTDPTFHVSTNSLGNIQDCCRLTALIFTNTILRHTPSASALMFHFVGQHKLALEETALATLWEDHSEVLLWVLFLGGSAVHDTSMRTWYVTWLVAVCEWLKLHTWQDTLHVLKKFIMAEGEVEKRCRGLWYEVVVGLKYS